MNTITYKKREYIESEKTTAVTRGTIINTAIYLFSFVMVVSDDGVGRGESALYQIRVRAVRVLVE